MQENSRDLAHFPITYRKNTGNTQETQDAFLAATFLSTARKIPEKGKGVVIVFQSKQPEPPQTEQTEALKAELIFPRFHHTSFLYLVFLHIQVALKNCHGKQNLVYCTASHRVKEI